MIKTAIPNRRRRKKPPFNPNRAYIDDAVEAYLLNGGKITKIIVDENMFRGFIAYREHSESDFLTDGC